MASLTTNAFPSDPNKTLDADGDGVAVEDDPDDADPDNPNPQTPAEAPSLSILLMVQMSPLLGRVAKASTFTPLVICQLGRIQRSLSPHTESVDGAKFFKLTNE